MKKFVYYHLYLPDETAAWANYLLEHYKQIEDSGLADVMDEFHLILVGKPQNIRLAKGLAKALNPKTVIHEFEDVFKGDDELHLLDTDLHGKQKRPVTECATLALIYEHALREDGYFLYTHAKGVTSYQRHLRAQQYVEFKNYFYWRKFLEWGTIEHWKKCTEYLEQYDIVSCNYSPWPMKHFSGNYWWSKSEYIKKLPDIRNTDWWKNELELFPIMKELTWRLKDEMWACSHKDCKTYSLGDADHPPPEANLAIEFFPRKKYGDIKV